MACNPYIVAGMKAAEPKKRKRPAQSNEIRLAARVGDGSLCATFAQIKRRALALERRVKRCTSRLLKKSFCEAVGV